MAYICQMVWFRARLRAVSLTNMSVSCCHVQRRVSALIADGVEQIGAVLFHKLLDVVEVAVSAGKQHFVLFLVGHG